MPGCNSIGQAMVCEPGGYTRLDHTLHQSDQVGDSAFPRMDSRGHCWLLCQGIVSKIAPGNAAVTYLSRTHRPVGESGTYNTIGFHTSIVSFSMQLNKVMFGGLCPGIPDT